MLKTENARTDFLIESCEATFGGFKLYFGNLPISSLKEVQIYLEGPESFNAQKGPV